MKGKTRIASAIALLAGGALLLPGTAPAQGTVPGAPWVPLAEAAVFDPLEDGIDGRPSLLLETDYYVYGPGTGFTVPEVRLTARGNGLMRGSTLYLYWENRDTAERMYFNTRDGFGAAERSLFEDGAGRPIKVRVPELDDFVLFGPDGAFGPLPVDVPTTTGLYQFVLEARNPGTEAVTARGNAMYNFVDAVVQKAGNIEADETWTANNAYVLTAPVNFFDATLTIEPGTFVLGVAADNPGTLIIRSGSRIVADGDPMRPIVMTSDQVVGERQAGDWGGLVVNGDAPTNQQNPMGEGDSGVYGGENPNNDAGILRYVRVEFAGNRFSDQNELNGIALQGAGRGTVVEHVQVHFNQDDGIEFFGGTVDAKWVLLTGIQDDSFDWTFGWQGRVQFLVVVQQGQEADKGIEADNFEDDFNALPRSGPTLSHCTFVKKPEVTQIDPAWQFRRGTDVTIQNCIVTGANSPDAVVLVDPDEPPNNVVVNNSFFFGNAGPNPPGGLGNNFFNDPNLADPFALVPDISPLPGSPARSGSVNINDPFFMNVSFVGGVDPADPWIYEGWTTFSDN